MFDTIGDTVENLDNVCTKFIKLRTASIEGR